jgi:hypothetical protein
MSGAVCPSCGVAVVPGYVRCPKCRKPLPQRQSAVEGGTALEAPSSNAAAIGALVGALVIGGGIIAFFALRGDDKKPAATRPAVDTEDTATTDTEPTTPTPDRPTTPTVVTPTGPQPEDIAAQLERELKKQRLWATVTVIGARADVRSSSCSEPGMAPMLDGAAPAFKAAGLTKLRCLEQSGRVVTDRDL